MTDIFDAATRSRIMSSVPSKGTRPEIYVGEMLKTAGFKCQAQCADLPGHPDFVFARKKLAIFVNGCFWHWHGCSRCSMPSSNRTFWKKKIVGNVARDRKTRSSLHKLGWWYLTIWECNLNGGLSRCKRVLRQLKDRPPGEQTIRR